MSGCVTEICENLSLPTELGDRLELLLRIHQVQESTAESMCLCIFLQH